jgi:hypothetical protein
MGNLRGIGASQGFLELTDDPFGDRNARSALMGAASNSSSNAGSTARPNNRSREPRTAVRVLLSPSLSRCIQPMH